MPYKEEYERRKAQGICGTCGANPAEEGHISCKVCLEHKREYGRAYHQTPQYRKYHCERQKTPQYRKYMHEYKKTYRDSLYGIYCCYMPQLDQFKLGYGSVYNRLCNYRTTDFDTTIVAYTELDKKTAKREEKKILCETLIYNPNGNSKSEMRLNCAPVRQYIKDNFDVINDETILNIRAQKRIVQAKL
jgi:hypothetical protein